MPQKIPFLVYLSVCLSLSDWQSAPAQSGHGLKSTRIYLGKNGELIGTSPNRYFEGSTLICTAENDLLVLKHDGVHIKGLFAEVHRGGIVVRLERDRTEKGMEVTDFKYAHWPFLATDGTPLSVPSSGIVLPSQLIQQTPATKPENSIGWLVELMDGTFILPDQNSLPPPTAVWMVVTGKMISLIRNGDPTPLITLPGSIPHGENNSNANLWPFVNEQGIPIPPVLTLYKEPVRRPEDQFVTMKNGAIALPQMNEPIE